MTQVCGIPLSRAYWELKAEQVMNRVFAPEASIDLEIIEPAPPPLRVVAPAEQPEAFRGNHSSGVVSTTAPVQEPQGPERVKRRSIEPPTTAQRPANGASDQLLLMGGLTLMALLLAGGTLTGLSFWGQYQQSLQQERNMLLIERLRSLGPDARNNMGSAADQPNPRVATAGSGSGPELPPPPPDEPWMQELDALPIHSGSSARILHVPISDQIRTPANADKPQSMRSENFSTATPEALPQLVGIIQIPGRPATAILQSNGTSTTTGVGERIGTSGWKLISANADSAVIERNGTKRTLGISNGL